MAIDVLNKGFVDLVDHLGNDLTVVNAARVSFGKRKSVFGLNDIKLLEYLAKHKHMSPFRHVQLQFHIKAPEFVMRQIYKHVVGCEWTSGEGRFTDHAWNEISGRYVEYEPEFYVPEAFRPQAQNSKQASEDGDLSDVVAQEIDTDQGTMLRRVKHLYEDAVDEAYDNYRMLLKAGVSREQARCLLPVSFYTEVYWTASLQAVFHFCNLRTDEHAQYEIQQYAHAVQKSILDSGFCPHAWKALTDYAS